MAGPRFWVNDAELDALSGLPLAARVAYLEGIKPFMDYRTGIVGASNSPSKSISLQSLAEVLYVEPKQGRKDAGSRSRRQVEMCITQLIDAGLISSMSVANKGFKRLILKCVLADTDDSVQKKHVSKTLQEDVPKTLQIEASNANSLGSTGTPKDVAPENPKDVTPPYTYNTDTTLRAGAREALLIPEDFQIDQTVRTRLVMAGVRLEVAEFFLEEFRAANESSGYTSMSWPAELVKYCKRWEWRYDKERGNNDAASGGDSQQQGRSKASRAHQRDKRLYQEAVADEQGAEDFREAESPLRPQVVVTHR